MKKYPENFPPHERDSDKERRRVLSEVQEDYRDPMRKMLIEAQENIKNNPVRKMLTDLQENIKNDPVRKMLTDLQKNIKNDPVRKMLADLQENIKNDPVRKMLADLQENIKNDPVRKMLADVQENIKNDPVRRMLSEISENFKHDPVQKMLIEMRENLSPAIKAYNGAFSNWQSQLLRKNLESNVTQFPSWYDAMVFALSARQSEINDFLYNQPLLANKAKLFPENFYNKEFWTEIDKVRNSYLGNLAGSFRQAILESDDGQEAIEKISSFYEEKVAPLPKDHFLRDIAINTFITVFLTVVQLWYSHYLAELSSAELKTYFGDISKKLDKIESKLGQLEVAGNVNDIPYEKHVYYVIQRPLVVKNRPDFSAKTIDYLSSRTKVRMIVSKHKWIYVEYIDYFDLVPKYGWVSKKYLKRLELN